MYYRKAKITSCQKTYAEKVENKDQVENKVENKDQVENKVENKDQVENKVENKVEKVEKVEEIEKVLLCAGAPRQIPHCDDSRQS